VAEPLARYGAVEMLEDGVHLLRQAAPGTLLCHWAGSIPLALMALRFWNDITNPRTSDLLCLGESFAMALLLIWMNCWRAVFAGRLRRQLSGASDAPWTGGRIRRLIGAQAFLGASRLIVLPCALAIGFPLAAVMAFYRDAAALSDRGLEPAEVINRARRLARRGQGQTWTLIAFLLLLGFLVTANVFLALAILPQLVRMLTGYESVFSRGGPYFLANSMFVAVVLALTWLAFDPYVQAVFGVRGFRAESIETGEDLRAGLRRVRSAAAVLLVILVMTPRVSAAVSVQELREASRQAVTQHEYDWRLPPPAEASGGKPWLIEFTDRAIAGVRKALDGLGDLLGRFFRWLNDRFTGRPSVQEGPPPALGLHWTIGLLTAAIALAAAWAVWRRRRTRRPKQPVAAGVVSAIRLDAEDLAADLLREEEWLAMAERYLTEGNPRLALRALYLANLAWLGRREWISIHPGKTNREYEGELRRRARAVPAARDLFAENVRAFERVWYGCHEATAEEIDRFRRRAVGIKELGAAA
jgi:Domain of unknown function (DUF4129)